MQVKRNPIKLYSLFLWVAFSIVPLFAVSQSSTHSDSFRLTFFIAPDDTLSGFDQSALVRVFPNYQSAYQYVTDLPKRLRTEGFVSASVDSLSWYPSDAKLYLFLGKKYFLGNIHWSQEWQAERERIVPEWPKTKNSLPLSALPSLRERCLRYFEENGYPFATVWLDSIKIENNRIQGVLMVDKGPFYTIDSIIVHGDINLSPDFFSRHLSLPKGTPFDMRVMKKTDRLLLQLPFLSVIQPSDISFLGNAAVLNVYVKEKKSNVINGLVGVQPSARGNKLQLTGDFLLDLKNALNKGENLWLKWQQLQAKSPRLQLGLVWPYLLKSQFGIDASFELFKKDSQFLQIQSRIGVSQKVSGNNTIGVFLQWNSSSLLSGSIDSNKIKSEKKLPANQELRITGLGFSFNWNNTDYLYNPRTGNEWQAQFVVSSRKILKNNDILAIKSAGFNGSVLYDSLSLNTFQLRLKSKYAHFFKTGKFTTFKLGLQVGAIGGKSIFRNELFQIGGFSTIRGFDEESRYASSFGIVTLEQRVLLGKNAYMSFFADGAVAKSKIQDQEQQYGMFGVGSGLSFETKAGILNLCLAFGNSNDRNFAIRESVKLHFGFVNVF